jgi:hypothetical protein
MSRPDAAPALSAAAAERLSRQPVGGWFGIFRRRRGAAALKREMERAYDLVIVALCGASVPYNGMLHAINRPASIRAQPAGRPGGLR